MSSTPPELGELAESMGIRLLEAAPARVVATMTVAGNRQPAGVLNGGAHCVIAETLSSLAAVMHAGEGRTAYGIELNASHHRSVSEGTVTATATAISLGRTLVTHEVVIRDESERRLSTVRVTNIIRPVPSPTA
jgi:1,4-dihydroxy-2-naphthoyl-CoA hydrolase